VTTTDDEPTIRASSVVSKDSDQTLRDTTPNIASGQVVLTDDKKTPEIMERDEKMPTSP